MNKGRSTDAKEAVFIEVLLHKEKTKQTPNYRKSQILCYVVVLLLMFKYKTYYYLYTIHLYIDL